MILFFFSHEIQPFLQLLSDCPTTVLQMCSIPSSFPGIHSPHLSQNIFCFIWSLIWYIINELKWVVYLHLSHCRCEWDCFNCCCCSFCCCCWFLLYILESTASWLTQLPIISVVLLFVICGGWLGLGLSLLPRSSPFSRQYFRSKNRKIWSRTLRVSISSLSRVLIWLAQLRQITSSSDITTIYLHDRK